MAGGLGGGDGSRGRDQRSGEGGRHGSQGQEEVLLQVPKKQEHL